MTGFDKKTVHFINKGIHAVEFIMEVDVMLNEQWNIYKTIKVESNGDSHYEFSDGYSAHWIRVKVSEASTVTVQFIYN